MSSAFDLVKSEVNLVDAIEHYTGIETKECGTDTKELDTRECPFCGHKDCFKIKTVENPNFFKCFSCDENGDVVSFVQLYKKYEKPGDALLDIAKLYNVVLPKSKSAPYQEAMNLAAEYYANNLLSDTTEYECLGGLTPLEYQKQTRGHTEENLKEMRVGWADGNLHKYLEALGIDKEVIRASGLLSKKGYDFFARNCFIYPQYVKGNASHFTLKDPTKEVSYQFKKDYSLNNVMVYNQDDIDNYSDLLLVEGENDLLSVRESNDWEGGVVGIIGQLSKDQITWLSKALQGKNVVTALDNDEAGDKYRNKLASLSVEHKINIDHIVVPLEYKDIDNYLKQGNSLQEALRQYITHVNGGVEVKEGTLKFEDINVYEKEGHYYKVIVKNEEPVQQKISDFTLQLKYIMVVDGRRFRVVNIYRQDNRYPCENIVIDAETKVTLRLFKKKMAEFADSFFFGNEKDLDEMWKHIFAKDGEFLVDTPKEAGLLKTKGWEGCWIFKNVFIDRNGTVTRPDENGVFWPKGKKERGIKPQSISLDSSVDDDLEDVPELTELNKESDYEEAVEYVLKNLESNFGNRTQAITAMAWCMANAYSDYIFKGFKFFPFLFIWGKYGGGKSGILKLLLAIYNMDELGSTTVGSLKSGVGFERKMAYYSSLPLGLDEVRNDRDTKENYPNFRKWFNREGRSMGSREDPNKIQQREVRSNIIFSGEEIIEESAIRSRNIPIRLAKMEDSTRETEETYKNLSNAQKEGVLSAVGLYWIRQAAASNPKKVIETIKETKNRLKELCPDVRTRTLDIYSIVATFGQVLSHQYYPEVDYLKDISEIIEEDTQEQDSGDILSRFFEILDGVIASEESPLTQDHVYKNGENKIIFWLSDIHKKLTRTLREAFDGHPVSYQAVLKALREEEFFVDEGRYITSTGQRRRCVEIDLSHDKCPDSIQNIANNIDKLKT